MAHELAVRATEKGIETWLGYGMTEAASTVTAKQINDVSNAGHLLKIVRLSWLMSAFTFVDKR